MRAHEKHTTLSSHKAQGRRDRTTSPWRMELLLGTLCLWTPRWRPTSTLPPARSPLRLLQKHNHNQNLLYLIGTVFPPQLLAAITAVVGDDVVDVHVLGVEENKLAVAIDHLAQLGDQRMV